MLGKLLMVTLLLASIAGCSGHATSMQDVSSYCRSLATEEFCDTQGSICAQYSEVMLAPYKTAKECRQSCESIRMKMGLRLDQQDCLQLMNSVEDRCNEFCNSNYED